MKLSLFVIGAVLGYCAGVYRKSIWASVRRFGHHQENAPKDDLRDAIEQAHEERSSENPVEKEVDLAAAKEQFIISQDKFSGIYENLYQSVDRQAKGESFDISDWSARMDSLSGCPDLQAFWADSQQDLGKVLSFFESCGVKRDDREVLTVDESTRYHYVDIDGGELKPGATYRILLPVWHNGAQVLGKGIIQQLDE